MGVQFWWFYDVIAAAVILVCVFLAVRKRLMKAAITLTGLVLAAIIAFSASGPVANLFYGQSVRSSNIKKFDLSLESADFIEDLANYIDTLGYNVRIQNDSLKAAFKDEKDPEGSIYKYLNNINNREVDEENIFINKLHEGYATVISNYIAKKTNEYVAESAAEVIRKHPEKAYEFAELLADEDTKRPASQYITENFTKKPYVTQIRLIVFLIVFVVCALIAIAIGVSSEKNSTPIEGFVANSISGILGIAMGVIFIIAIAAMIRLYVIMGSNKMLFFNHEAIESTYVFKYFYDLVSGF
ncbi:hypothetical protein [Ruminococcus flavefaciens]|uniref:hypothetical protein n=1 Tax=Ruminococcus flavefaciens TaxID=1265 RepID=UPI000465AE62|nr:hypothetical protein [Ruminococcus flavefaciens]